MNFISNISIIKKMLAINILILLAVAAIAGSNISGSKQIEATLVPLVNDDVKQIIRNSEIARELNTMFTELNILLKTFTEHRDVLAPLSKQLSERITNQLKASNHPPALMEKLLAFNGALNTLFEKCRDIVRLMQEIESSDAVMEKQVEELENAVSEMLMQAKASGKTYSLFSLEQVSIAIPDIQYRLLQIRMNVAELTRKRIGIKVDETEEDLFSGVFGELNFSVSTVQTGGSEIAAIGKKLAESVGNHRQLIADYKEVLNLFQQAFSGISSAQNSVITAMREIDEKTENSARQIHDNITEKLHIYRNSTVILSAIAGTIIFFAGFFMVRMIRPLSELAKISGQLTRGDIRSEIRDVRSNDEIGTLFRVFRQLIETTRKTTEVVEEIAAGNLTVEVKERSGHDRMMQALNRMISNLRQTAQTARSVSEGDLNVTAGVLSEDDILGKSLEKMLDNLKKITIEVQNTSTHVAYGSEQLNTAADKVASGSSQQAASVEEIASSMEEMASMVNQNAGNAGRTALIAEKAAKDAEAGNKAVNETILAMESISEKILVIEEIAGQTNLLALNAAIEAARAEQQGKGFAVVATEVRELAKTTKNAAQDISMLSASNLEIAGKTGNLLQEMVGGIKETAELLQGISISSNEQATGIAEVNKAVQQFGNVIQENAASAEQMSSTSLEFLSQAEKLTEAVSFFKISDEEIEKLTKGDEHAPEIEKLVHALEGISQADKEVLVSYFRLVTEKDAGNGEPEASGTFPEIDIKKEPEAEEEKGAAPSESSPKNEKNGCVIDIGDETDRDFEEYR